jgi:hypothetical protein
MVDTASVAPRRHFAAAAVRALKGPATSMASLRDGIPAQS